MQSLRSCANELVSTSHQRLLVLEKLSTLKNETLPYTYIYICIYIYTYICRPLRPRRVRTCPTLPNKNLLITPTFQYNRASKKQQNKKTGRPWKFNTLGRLIRPWRFNKPGRFIKSQDRLAYGDIGGLTNLADLQNHRTAQHTNPQNHKPPLLTYDQSKLQDSMSFFA